MVVMLTRVCAVISLAVAACSFSPSGTAAGDGDAAIDRDSAPSGDAGCAATCDQHASCVGSACVCSEGWTGDGVSCADVDECATSNGGCAQRCADRDGGFTCYAPASCAELRAQEPEAGDDEVTLYANDAPWTAICEDMATAPATYLKLPADNVNYAQYTRGGVVRTSFTAVRIDPAALRIDIDDLLHATSTGSVSHSGTPVIAMPFGVAMDCGGQNSATGSASVDLTETPFAVANPTLGAGFTRGGNSNSGSVTSVPGFDDQLIVITGGGNCGWVAPTQTPTAGYFNPFNPPQTAPAFTHILQLTRR